MKVYLIEDTMQHKYLRNYTSWGDFADENLTLFNEYRANSTRSSKTIWASVKELLVAEINNFSALYDTTNNRANLNVVADIFQQELIKQIEQRTGLSIPQLLTKYPPPYLRNSTSSGYKMYYANRDSFNIMYDVIICCLLDLLQVREVELGSSFTTYHNIEKFVTKKTQRTYEKYKTITGFVSVEDLS